MGGAKCLHGTYRDYCQICRIEDDYDGELVELCDRLRQAEAEIERLRAELTGMEARKDGAYLERNKVVAALAKCFPSGRARTAIEGWSEDWHGCVYIDLPTGQVSWHFNDEHAALFDFLPPYAGAWDGHDTPEKYARLAGLDATDTTGLRADKAELERDVVWAVRKSCQMHDDVLVSYRERFGTKTNGTDAGLLDAVRRGRVGDADR